MKTLINRFFNINNEKEEIEVVIIENKDIILENYVNSCWNFFINVNYVSGYDYIELLYNVERTKNKLDMEKTKHINIMNNWDKKFEFFFNNRLNELV